MIEIDFITAVKIGAGFGLGWGLMELAIRAFKSMFE